MGEEVSDTMNFDLNLSPVPEIATANTALVLSDWANRPNNRDSDTPRRFKPQIEEDKSVIEKKSVGGFFDCYICLELSKEPVLTNCGHLYCWPCIYRWLQVSNSKECPVCNGEISVKTLTPIYGRGRKNEREVSDGKIPLKPQAKRVESLRASLCRESSIIGTPFLNPFMTWRGVRAELVPPVDEEEREIETEIGDETERLVDDYLIEENNVVEGRDSGSGVDVEARICTMLSNVSNAMAVRRAYGNGSRVSTVDSAEFSVTLGRRRRRRLS